MQFCVAEKDARATKTCPMSLARPDGMHSYGGPHGCHGSDCMAWRWVETHLPDEHGNLTVLSGDTHGYCGMAGPPWRRE